MDELYLHPYRDYNALLAEPDDMTESERHRLERIKVIPPEVRKMVEGHVCQLRSQIMKAEEAIANLREDVVENEREADRLIDYLNGEVVEGQHEKNG